MLALVGCAESEESHTALTESAADAPLSVYVVSEPLRSFARRIGAEQVEVSFPAPPGVDPAHWSPGAETLADYQRADLILLNGAGYASWVARASLPRAALVDTSAAARDDLIEIREGVTHQHGPDGEHRHLGTAFTTWLDPQLATLQAQAVAAAFQAARPESADTFRANLASLESELSSLDARLTQATSRLDGAPVLFSHPVYQYFERRYGLDGRSLDWEPDAHPADAAWAALDALLAGHPAELILWEAEPLDETRRALEERGVRSVVFAPGGGRGAAGEDWLALMAENAARLEKALQAPTRPLP
jgi:zinc transport system substrate-binding protein